MRILNPRRICSDDEGRGFFSLDAGPDMARREVGRRCAGGLLRGSGIHAATRRHLVGG